VKLGLAGGDPIHMAMQFPLEERKKGLQTS
jgi:hypothetical protein